jgi:hypothetical protein
MTMMNDDLSSKTACVVDHGLFVHIALCLAEKFGKVFYVGPSERLMPHLADAVVGDGFDKIERVTDLWKVKSQCDCFVFPDIGFAGEQEELKSQGLAVWGHHGADVLEVNKGRFLKTLAELGMEVPPYEIVVGLTNLRKHLWDLEDKWIKVSRWRGDWETFHWRNRTMDEVSLDCAAYRLGPWKEFITFYVFDKIETVIEDGTDTWRVGGQWPRRVLHAMEHKDKCLIGAMQDHTHVMEEVWAVNESFGPVLDKFGYQGAFSTEVRVTEEEAFFIDPTCRFGSPPSQLQTVLIDNLPEVIWHGAHGDMVEPETEHEFGAQALITSDREKDEWLVFQMPEELRPYVKSAFSCEVDGVFTIAPNPIENWAGWLVATGDSVEEVIETMKERKDMLPDGFECDLAPLADVLKEMEEAKDEGIQLAEEVPSPETVLS